MDNSTWEDIRILVNAIIYRIGFFPFCNSITDSSERESMDRDGDDSRSTKPNQLAGYSQGRYLITVHEALGLTYMQILDSGVAVIETMTAGIRLYLP